MGDRSPSGLPDIARAYFEELDREISEAIAAGHVRVAQAGMDQRVGAWEMARRLGLTTEAVQS